MKNGNKIGPCISIEKPLIIRKSNTQHNKHINILEYSFNNEPENDNDFEEDQSISIRNPNLTKKEVKNKSNISILPSELIDSSNIVDHEMNDEIKVDLTKRNHKYKNFSSIKKEDKCNKKKINESSRKSSLAFYEKTDDPNTSSKKNKIKPIFLMKLNQEKTQPEEENSMKLNIKNLHLITQKAMSNKVYRHNDRIDDNRLNFVNFTYLTKLNDTQNNSILTGYNPCFTHNSTRTVITPLNNKFSHNGSFSTRNNQSPVINIINIRNSIDVANISFGQEENSQQTRMSDLIRNNSIQVNEEMKKINHHQKQLSENKFNTSHLYKNVPLSSKKSFNDILKCCNFEKSNLTLKKDNFIKIGIPK